jgi:hypothetical protein
MNRSTAATRRDHTDLLGAAGRTHPTVAQWIAGLNHVPAPFASRPAFGA